MSLQVVYLPYAVPITIPKAGGGGGVSPVSFDVNPDYNIEHTLEATETYFSIQLTNSNPTVAAGVALSFSNQALKVDINDADSVPDSGDENNPSYVIPPANESGSTRTIRIIRGATAPSYGDPDTTCSISYTLSNGTTVDYQTQFIVQALTLKVHEVIRNFSDPIEPTYEFIYDDNNNNFVNTGTIGGINSSTNMNITPDVLTYPGFAGYAEATASNSHHYRNANQSTTCRTTTRSWIYAFHIVADTSGSYVHITHGTSGRTGAGWVYKSGSIFKWGTVNLDSTHNHTDGQSSVACTPTSGTTVVMCASYDHIAQTLTYRWKRTGETDTNGQPRSGHSYKVLNSIGTEGSSGSTFCAFAGYAGSSYITTRYLNTTIIDTIVSENDFNEIIDVMGL